MSSHIAKYLAVDIGGTTVKICKFDNAYQLISSDAFSTSEYSTGSRDLVSEIKDTVEKSLEDSIERIGISFNCVVNEGVVIYSSLLGGAINYRLEDDFGHEFGLPVRLINDVNSMAVAESRFGHGSNVHSFVLMNLGTGVRLSFVKERQLLIGYNGNLGEISQRKVLVPELGKEPVKVDDLVSGKGLSSLYGKISGSDLTAEQVFVKASTDQAAQKAIDLFIKYLGYLLEDITYYYNPETVVINGSMKMSAEYFMEQSFARCSKNVPEFMRIKNIKISAMDHAACLGSII